MQKNITDPDVQYLQVRRKRKMTKIFYMLFLHCEILLKMSDLDGVFIIFLTAYLGLFYLDHVSFNHGSASYLRSMFWVWIQLWHQRYQVWPPASRCRFWPVAEVHCASFHICKVKRSAGLVRLLALSQFIHPWFLSHSKVFVRQLSASS